MLGKFSPLRKKKNTPQDLLENRLTFLMKIKHPAFLFEIIFLKKSNYIALQGYQGEF